MAENLRLGNEEEEALRREGDGNNDDGFRGRGGDTTSQRSFPAIWREKRFLLSKLNAITCLTITSKWSITMMEIFLSLDKYLSLHVS